MSNTTHFCLLSHRAYGSASDIYEIIYIYERYKRSELKRVKPLCLKYIKEDIDIVHMKNTEKASCIFTFVAITMSEMRSIIIRFLSICNLIYHSEMFWANSRNLRSCWKFWLPTFFLDFIFTIFLHCHFLDASFAIS